MLNADGGEIANDGLGRWPSMIPGCDVYMHENGDNLIACGTTQSKVHALRLNGSRLETLWNQEVGEEAHAVVAADVDGDGRPEVAAGSDCFCLYLFGEDGMDRWRRNLMSPVRRVFTADVNQDGGSEIVAGCEDGNVWIFDGEGKTIGAHQMKGPIHA